jgi:cytidylate kinase
MPIVTISRGTFSGGQKLAECLASTLGYRCVDRDTLVRKAATGRVTEYDLRAALEQPPAFPGRLNHQRYIYLTLIQAALWEEVRFGNVVYHGLAGHLLLKGAPGLCRLRIVAPLEARIRMACERLNISREQAVAYIDRADHDRRKWTQFLYGVDWESPLLYDLTINLDHITLERACKLAVSAISEGAFEGGNAKETDTQDLLLASTVRRALALDPSTLNLEVEVESRSGCIFLRGDNLEEDWSDVERVIRKVPGVAGCQLMDATQASRSSTI